MDTFQKEFLMEMFLDTDMITTVNRAVVTVANIVNENTDNLNAFNEAVKEYWNETRTVSDYFTGIVIPPHRIKDYYEHAVLNFTDDEYESTFKVKRSTVQALVKFMTGLILPGTIPIEKKVHVFLMFLMSDLSFNDIGRLFGLHKSSVSYIFQELGSVLMENRYNYISWPSVEEQHVTRLKVNSRFKFPNCVGFIDACRLKVGMKAPSKPEYLLLQGVCDDSLLFIDIYVGEVGKVRKYKVFKDSTLMYELQNFVDFENHILGDSDYKININLITPFNSEELLTSEEMKFNEVHWKTRSYVGRAFELLKERFRKLNHIDIFKNNSINILIYSACVLHNFIIMHEGCTEVKEEAITCDDSVTLNTDIVMTATEKRQFLCNYINYMDSDYETF